MEEEEGKVIHPPSTPAKKAPFEKRRKEPALHKRRMSEWTIYRPQLRCVQYIFRSTQGRRDRGRPKSVAGANGPAVKAPILNKRREKRAVGAYIL